VAGRSKSADSGQSLDVAGDRDFPTTSWSVVGRAQDPASPTYQQQMGRLAQRYWRPVYWLIRHGWKRADADARDLTQEFFATIVFEGALCNAFAPERGSFRKLVRAAVTNFMRNELRDAGRQKRGGQAIILSLDQAPEEEIADAASLTPDQLFEIAWTRTVMREALALTERRLDEQGKGFAMEAFRRHDLQDRDPPQAYSEISEALGLSVPQVKHALRLAREAFRDAVAEIVSEYVEGPEETAREIQNLLKA
jgi:RNA polymerase sigma factor (sigma-70 family)